MENSPKPPLLEVWGVGKRYRKGLWSLRKTNLLLSPGILGLMKPDRPLRTVLVVVSSAVLTTLLVVALLAGNLPLNLEALWQTLSSPERVRALSEGFEVWVPIVFFSIQAARVVVPLVPAGPITLVGVAVFGPWLGFVLTLLGAFAGSVSAFLLARRFSRPLVTRLVGEKTLDKHAGKMGPDGKWMLVALMMPLPTVGDAVCALAGLSKISLGRFAVLNLLGRIPYTTLTVLLASGLTIGSGGLQIGGGIIAALLAGAAFFYTWHRRLQQRHLTRCARSHRSTDEEPE
jgi:uncharacterized membrane protein YdjX (TVP38/TMEM64 family)